MISTILMIRPVAFRTNEETVINNYFQKELGKTLTKNEIEIIQIKALKEFDNLVKQLKKVGVNVIVIEDTLKPDTPDSIFSNNWISFHNNGTVCMYPMFAKNRRLERREDILEIVESNGFKIKDIIDYTSAEEETLFLEGTGSMVLDRENSIAYCSLSTRSSESVFIEFCEDLEYTPVIFRANQQIKGKRKPIYHTNVMMSIGKKFAIVCLESITDKKQRKHLISTLNNSGKQIIIINQEQVNNFAGNTLEVTGKDNKDYIVMSKTAIKSLSNAQITIIEKHGEIISSNVKTIESNGGGSVRCMMTKVVLPK